ncbi:DUF1493 family protein [Paraburkholderia aspalathi]|uniref:Acyl carrier protein n=1 Tax=Paraburkholderia nemoris TaxID=2793076 RepID=A0ABM8RME3_9BURK|nr:MULTISPECIES: DUF1493 family protein [Paraburkholderia]MBK3811464.1 DUF1493 family protein [Paraburkholderia aspalathi]CAE6760898.1 hypothetical protein R69776_03366 [Paraburkholderia nemoris]
MSETKDEVWKKLEAFAREELGKPIFGQLRIEPDSKLEDELGLTGTDAVEFIDKWAERFGVAADGFPYGRYFGPEGLDLIGAVASLFSKRDRKTAAQPLTLGMLADAMRAGRWDTAAIEAARSE